MTIYQQLEVAVSHHIKAYRLDLTHHDEKWISENPDVPFLHFSRSCGTHMLPLPDATTYPAKTQRVPSLFGTADRGHMLSEVVSFCDRCADCETTKAIYYFNGQKLIHTSASVAKETARQYRSRIYAQWDKQATMAKTEYVHNVHLA